MYCSFDFALYSGHGNFELELKEVNEFLAKLEVPSWQNATRTTGKSLSEALLFTEHGENIMCTKIVLYVRNNFCTQHVLPRFELGIFMH